MKPKTRPVMLALLLLILVAFSGCSQQELLKNRQTCLELTQPALTTIPECGSIDQCFQEVESSFPIDDSPFSPEVRENILLYKNRLAQSWLHANTALEKFSKVNSLCSQPERVRELPPMINSASHSLVQAFNSIDSAGKTSFSILGLEKFQMELEEIELIKEEPLYLDYIALNNNLNELLSDTHTKNSDSYVSLYFQRMNEFNLVSGSAGFQPVSLTEFSLLELVETPGTKEIADAFKEMPFNIYLPLLVKTAKAFTDQLGGFSELDKAVKALQNLSGFEVTSRLDGFLGRENSVASKFFSMLESDSSHRLELEQRNKEVKQSIVRELDLAGERLKGLGKESYLLLDENFFSMLNSLLGQGTEIRAKVFSFSGVPESVEEAAEEKRLVEEDFTGLLALEFTGQTSLGGKTSALKEILSRARQLNARIDFIEDEVKGLEAVCGKRADEIDEQASEIIGLSDELAVSNLAEKTRFRIAGFRQASGLEQKLPRCRAFLESHERLLLAINDRQAFRDGLFSSINSCLSTGKQLVEQFQRYLDLSTELARLENLNQQNQETVEPELALDSCENLLSGLEKRIREKGPVSLIAGNRNLTKTYIEKLREMRSLQPEAVDGKKFLSLESRFLEQENYFENNRLDLLKAAQKIQGILPSSEQLLWEVEGLFTQSMKRFLELNVKAVFISPKKIIANRASEATLILSLNNPITAFDKPLELELPMPVPDSYAPVSVPQDLRSLEFKNSKIVMELSGIPLGKTDVYVNLKANLASTSEKDGLVHADLSEAVFERIITFSTPGKIKALEVESSLPDGHSLAGISIAFKDKPVGFNVNGNKLFFELQNVSDKDRAVVRFAVPQPLDFSLSLLDEEKTDGNTMRYDYLLEFRNRLPIELPKPEITVPLPLEDERITSIKFTDLSGKEVKHSSLPLSRVFLELPSISAAGREELYLSLEVREYADYWEDVISSLRETLTQLSSSANQGIRTESTELLGSLAGIETASLSSEEENESLFSLSARASELALEQEILLESEGAFQDIKAELESEIAVFESHARQLEGFGFGEEAGSFHEIISFARAELEKASELGSAGAFHQSLEKAYDARALLQGVEPGNAVESIKSAADSLIAGANNLFSLSAALSLESTDLKATSSAINAIYANLSENLRQANFIDAKQQLELMSNLTSDYNSSLAGIAHSTAESFMDSSNRFTDLISESIPGGIDALKQLLQNTGKEELAEAGYAPPLSRERLEELEEALKGLDDKSLAKGLDAFSSAFSQGDFFAALESLKPVKKTFDSKFKKAVSIKLELDSAMEKLKEDSLLSYNRAVEKFNLFPQSDDAEQELLESKNALGDEDYLKAVVHARNATALMSFSQTSEGFEIPLSIYPLIVLVGAVAFFKIRASRKKEFERVKKVFRKR